jgi:hypothetical protein
VVESQGRLRAAQVGPAVCQPEGPRVTNGNDADPADDGNPQRFTSNRYYGVRWNGRIRYLSEVWVTPLSEAA